jgi:uncharacterized protein DUF1553
MTSAVYRLESAPPAVASPWLVRYPEHRLEAEAIRDSLLAVAGSLDPAIGGPELEPAKASGSNRRSLYFSHHAEGGGHLKILELFDAADPCDGYRRSATISPQQALALTNSPLALDASRKVAARLEKEADVVGAAFEAVLGRAPTPAEREACRAFLDRGGARDGLVRALFNHHDFVTIP